MELIDAIKMVQESCKVAFGEAHVEREMILDCATRIFNTNRMDSGSKSSSAGGSKPDVTKMASQKQKDFLKQLKCQDDPNTFTMLQAKVKIDELIAKRDGAE